MRSVSLCHAVADRQFAEELAAFLEMNLPFRVSLEDAVVGDCCDVLDATERALSAEAALVVLSPASVPGQLELNRWKHVFIDQPKQFMTHLGFVLTGECPFPKLLRRQRFFDAKGDRLGAMREIKRWLLRPMSLRAGRVVDGFEEMRRAIVDRPGALVDVDAGVAALFAEQCAQDFQDVYRLDCTGLARAGVAGEIAGVAGSGEDRRVLFAMSGVAVEDRDVVPLGGLASAVFVAAGAVIEGAIQNPASDAWRTFQGSHTPGDGWSAVKLLKDAGRLEEALAVLAAMKESASGDEFSLGRIEREMFWVMADMDFAAAGFVEPLGSGGGGQLSFVFE